MHISGKKPLCTFFYKKIDFLFVYFSPYFLIIGLSLYRGLREGGSCGWDLEDVINWKSAF